MCRLMHPLYRGVLYTDVLLYTRHMSLYGACETVVPRADIGDYGEV